MKELKAFTIIELTVAMLITGIVFIIGYYCYNIIATSFYNYKKSTEKIENTLSFRNLIEQDFQNSILINGDEHEIDFKYENYEVNYHLDDTFVVRTQESLIDTFWVATDSIHITYISQNHKENYNSSSKSNHYIQDLLCKYSSTLGSYQLFLSKNYAAYDLLQTEEELYSDN